MWSANHDWRAVTLIRAIVSAVLVAMSSSVLAEREKVWSREYTVQIPFNDATTKGSARALALEQSRNRAAAEFGTGVLTDQELNDGVLKERTRVVTAGVSRMSVKRESYQENEKGVVSGEFLIQVQISQDELDRQFESLRRDASRDQKLRTLQRENEILEARLKGEGVSQSAETMVLQDLLKYAPRATTPEMVFPTGALMAVAIQSDRGADFWDRLESSLFKPLREANYRVQFGGAEIDGEDVNIRMMAQWRLNLSTLRANSLQFAPTYLSLPGAEYWEGFCIDPKHLPKQVYRDFMQEAVWLDVQIGSKREAFMIAGPMDSYWCLVDGSFGAGRRLEMSISSKDAATVGEIKTKIVRGRSIGNMSVSALKKDLMRPYFQRR